MRDELKEAIENHLLTAGGSGWVKSRELCGQFEITDRQLRKVGDRPGLVTEFTISGNKGFKHIDRATPGEFDEYYSRERQHSISALVTLRQKRTRRTHSIRTIKRPAFIFQKDNGQGVLL